MKDRTLVILSGGMDSTVLAYYIRSKPNTLIGCVSVDYGQRHKKELQCASITCGRLGVPHYSLDLSTVGEFFSSSVLTGAGDVPEGHYAEESMKATVVPNRNMILISLAVGVGVSVEASQVAYGAHSGDHAVYPDCRPEFADALQKSIALCDYNPPELIRPFINISKADIVSLGKELGVPFDTTWTCYKGGQRACGKCGTCVERLEAFAIADVEDPLVYEDRTYWKQAISRHPQQVKLL